MAHRASIRARTRQTSFFIMGSSFSLGDFVMLFYKGDRESIKVNRVTALFYIVIVYWMVRVDRKMISPNSSS